MNNVSEGSLRRPSLLARYNTCNAREVTIRAVSSCRAKSVSRGSPLSAYRVRKKITTPGGAAKQNHLVRINRALFARKSSRSVRPFSSTVPQGRNTLAHRGIFAANVSSAKRLPTGCAFRGQQSLRNFARQFFAASVPRTKVMEIRSFCAVRKSIRSFAVPTKSGCGVSTLRKSPAGATRFIETRMGLTFRLQILWNHILVQRCAATHMESYPCRKRVGGRGEHEVQL